MCHGSSVIFLLSNHYPSTHLKWCISKFRKSHIHHISQPQLSKVLMHELVKAIHLDQCYQHSHFYIQKIFRVIPFNIAEGLNIAKDFNIVCCYQYCIFLEGFQEIQIILLPQKDANYIFYMLSPPLYLQNSFWTQQRCKQGSNSWTSSKDHSSNG